jgi:alpha-mannosidase
MRRGTIYTIGLLVIAIAFHAVGVCGEDSNLKTPATQQADGTIQLNPNQATLHGKELRVLPFDATGTLCAWINAGDWASWQMQVQQPGEYVVAINYACADGSEGSTFEITLGESKLTGKIAKPTGSWYDYQLLQVGMVKLSKSGATTVSIKTLSKPGYAVMNLARIRLVPPEKYEGLRKADLLEPFAAINRPIFLVPNFHPASCGWLVDFSVERSQCAYAYLDHLDRVRDDPTYHFALSEVNNQMAIMAFEPERFEELKKRIREGRVELCNAFFLEPTINLSGGEALVKNGIEGLRWQQKVMGVRPRLAWMIDVCGVHEQMGQIVSGLGLDGMVYFRNNPTNSVGHWFESPDGSRTLGIAEVYSDLGPVFAARAPMNFKQLRAVAIDLQGKLRITPPETPIFVLGGDNDYSKAPKYKNYPRDFIEQWKAVAPNAPFSFTLPSKYLDALLPLLRSGKVQIPSVKGGTRMDMYNSLWNENPRAKSTFRRSEHQLQAAEAISSVASLETSFLYPVAPLYHSWLMMCLNMDRNSLWGAAGGFAFESDTSWDVQDRYNKVQEIANQSTEKALQMLLGKGSAVGLFNPMNQKRTAPFLAKLPAGTRLAGAICQTDAEGQTLCRLDLPPMSAAGLDAIADPPQTPQPMALNEKIETAFYIAKIDPASGALTSLKQKSSGRELLEKPVLIVAERGGDYHYMLPRPKRQRLADSGQFKPEIKIEKGPLATVVRARGKFYGDGELLQTIRFYADNPRIDFEVVTEEIPNDTQVLVEFPLAPKIQETRRGIPYGFSHGAWAKPNPELAGYCDGIMPAVRWSHYTFDDGGLAILDRGLPARELNGNTPVLFLMNAHDIYMGYRCSWLSGKPRQKFEFALYAHDGDWDHASVPQRAWEYNAPPLVVFGVKQAEAKSFVQTSDNVIVEALRREGDFLEMRLVECLGRAGQAKVTLALPHGQAFTTDLTGGNAKPLAGGPAYELPVRPQQIVTLRFKTAQAVEEIQPLLKWDELVPPAKLPKLLKKIPTAAVGHPPLGNDK